MSSYQTLFVLIINILIGIIYFFVSKFFYKLFLNIDKLIKYVLTMIFSFDLAILYILFMYKINYGIFHFYYLICFLLGYIMSYRFINKYVKKCKIYLINRFKS